MNSLPSDEPPRPADAPLAADRLPPPTVRDAEGQDGGLPPYPQLSARHLPRPYTRRVTLPVVLFLVTCVSTFWVGSTHWYPAGYLTDGLAMRRMILLNWREGLAYMGALLAILLCHEMGHFLTTVVYRIPASFPYFIPFPLSAIGTMGAVIGMAGHRADRKQTFDIGLAGPLAGLAVALPILWLGMRELDLQTPARGAFQIDCPWLVTALLPYVRPDLPPLQSLWLSQINPYFMAAWVGLLITGLNMMPVSQLDGGHVVYALLLNRGHWVARGFLLAAIAYVVLARAGMWSVMIIIVILIGTDHPPTSNDNIPLGWFRTLLGYASLAIPLLCFPAQGIIL